MSVGFFMLIPIMSYQLLSRPGMNAAYVAFLNNLRFICQDMAMIPCAYLLRRCSARKVLTAAALLRGLGFILYSAQSRALLSLAAVFTGLGGALFFPAAMQMYLLLTEEAERERVFARREMLNSLGAVIGPVLCSLLLRNSYKAVCIGAGLLYMLCGMLSMKVFPEIIPQERTASVRRESSWKGLLLFMVCCSLVAVWQNQQMIAMAVYAHNLDYAGVEWITLISYGLMTLVQMPLSRRVGGRIGALYTIALSVLLFVCSLAVQRFASDVWMLYAGNLLFALGIVLFVPAKNSVFAALHGRVEASILIGVHGLMTSLGSAFLGTAFGAMYNGDAGVMWIWLLLSGVAVAGVLGFISMRGIKLEGREIE